MTSDPPEVDDGWRLVSVVVDGDPIDVDGANPWSVGWTATGRTITVAHPQYPWQRHTMPVYEMSDDGRVVVFAAAELSACVWGFYVPR